MFTCDNQIDIVSILRNAPILFNPSAQWQKIKGHQVWVEFYEKSVEKC